MRNQNAHIYLSNVCVFSLSNDTKQLNCRFAYELNNNKQMLSAYPVHSAGYLGLEARGKWITNIFVAQNKLNES